MATTKAILTAVVILFVLGGCLPIVEQKENASHSAKDMVCRKEKKTGSNRTVMRCRPRQQSEIQKEQTKQDMRRIQSQTY